MYDGTPAAADRRFRVSSPFSQTLTRSPLLATQGCTHGYGRAAPPRSGGDLFRRSLGERPVGVHDAPLVAGETVAVRGVPGAELLLLAVLVENEGVEVVGEDGEVTAVADVNLRVEILAANDVRVGVDGVDPCDDLVPTDHNVLEDRVEI